ncbi:MAG: prepilin peptidase [Candidatus Hydrothermales bacterium]
MIETVLLTYSLMLMAFIDYETGYIYDVILFPSLYVAFIISSVNNHLIESIIYSFLAFLFGILLRWLGSVFFKKEALGEGDPYVFALIAAYIRGFDLILTFFLSFLLGSLVGLFLLFKRGNRYLPLLPFLFLGILLYYLIYPNHHYLFYKIFVNE